MWRVHPRDVERLGFATREAYFLAHLKAAAEQGPDLVCNMRRYSFDELPKNDLRFDPSGWWNSTDPHGKQQKDIDQTGDFFVQSVPYHFTDYHVNSLTGHDYYTICSKELGDWCRETLKGHWSPVIQSSASYFLFSNESDAVIFKMRWF